MIHEAKVHAIKDIDSLITFLKEDLNWQLPEGDISDITFDWTGTELNLSESSLKKLKGGRIRQLQNFRDDQPWGIFIVDFATDKFLTSPVRDMLRTLVSKKRGRSPDQPSWNLPDLLFICLYGEDGFTFAHFKGDKPYGSPLTTFRWHPGEPIHTLCEFNLPALEYDDKWARHTWVTEWQKAFDVEKVNKLFYREIAELYYRLTGKNKHQRVLVFPQQGDRAADKDYEEFAVRLIGRTIFCWFLKHKKSPPPAVLPLIPPEVLSSKAVKQNPDYYHSVLEPLFFEVMNKEKDARPRLTLPKSDAIPFLNGGLFESHPNDFYKDTPAYSLKVPDAWFVDFFTVLEKYNFTIDENSSINIDVSVDPEMLGRVFENLLAEVVPETGETARKATGSYYTPRTIVDYMVEQSLKQYLLTKTALGEEKISSLLTYGEEIAGFTPMDRLAVVKALTEIKIIDPACGSGAFPIGVLHRMLMALEKVDPKLELWQTQYLAGLDPMVRDTVKKNIHKSNWAYIRKLMIIRDCIYGVDIQPIAVEISKLRCFLSLVVDEIVTDGDKNRGIESLPNLEFKFVAANTLVGLPAKIERQGKFGISGNIKTLKLLRDEYLRSSGQEKKEVEKKFRQTQKKLQEENAWLLTDGEAKLIAEWDPFSYQYSAWFDPEWMFGVTIGFDIVIANPPYLGEKDHKETFDPVHNGTLKKYYQGQMDLFYFFFHLSLDISKRDANIAFITTDYYLTATSARNLRLDINERATVKHLIDFNELKIFESALGQHNMITILSKPHNGTEVTDNTLTKRKGLATPEVLNRILSGLDEETEYYQVSQNDLYDGKDSYIRISGNSVENNPIQSAINKIKMQGVLLSTLCNVNVGLYTGADKVSKNYIEKYSLTMDKNEGIFIITIDEMRKLNLNSFERSKICPFYKNSDIYRWKTKQDPDLFLINVSYPENREIDLNKISNIFAHISKYEIILRNRKSNDNGLRAVIAAGYWWSFTIRQIDFTKPKIVVPQRSQRNTFGYNEIPWYASADVYFITEKDGDINLKYCLALLNSKLYYLWLYHKGKRKGEMLELYQVPLSEIPIKKITKAEQNPFVLLVDKILALTQDKDYLSNAIKQANVKELEEQIDQLVYQLYDLTPDEIAVVEGKK